MDADALVAATHSDPYPFMVVPRTEKEEARQVGCGLPFSKLTNVSQSVVLVEVREHCVEDANVNTFEGSDNGEPDTERDGTVPERGKGQR